MQQATSRAGAQVGAQLDAQLGAQIEELHAMSLEPAADAEQLLRVLARHDIPQRDLARACNMLDGTLSRVLSGTYPVTLRIVRALFDMTGDTELVELLSTRRHAVIAVPSTGDRSPDLHHAYMDAQQAVHEVMTGVSALLTRPPNDNDRSVTDQRIDRAIAALQRLRRAATRKPAPAARIGGAA